MGWSAGRSVGRLLVVLVVLYSLSLVAGVHVPPSPGSNSLTRLELKRAMARSISRARINAKGDTVTEATCALFLEETSCTVYGCQWFGEICTTNVVVAKVDLQEKPSQKLQDEDDEDAISCYAISTQAVCTAQGCAWSNEACHTISSHAENAAEDVFTPVFSPPLEEEAAPAIIPAGAVLKPIATPYIPHALRQAGFGSKVDTAVETEEKEDDTPKPCYMWTSLSTCTTNSCEWRWGSCEPTEEMIQACANMESLSDCSTTGICYWDGESCRIIAPYKNIRSQLARKRLRSRTSTN